MGKKHTYRLSFFIWTIALSAFLLLFAFCFSFGKTYLCIGAGALALISFYKLYQFVDRRFKAVNDFFESVKYRDFSRWFVENKGAPDLQQLHTGFNEVNRVVKEINTEKETQYLYLQKILELVDIGIIAYNIETGKVLWSNESSQKILNSPSFKNIGFVEKRNPELFQTLFNTHHKGGNSIELKINNEQLQVLISDSIFQVKEETFKLIVLQNIDDTLNRNEAEAWKKLLSVMTHEIMNSIAPISSLANTLQTQVQQAYEKPKNNPLNHEDLNDGLMSIKNRSEGLMKFAKTYRSLNKVTHLNLEKIYVKDLFENLQRLMQPSLKDKNIEVEFTQSSPNLELKVDVYLIEQVLINLIINAVDSCSKKDEGKINISAISNVGEQVVLQVADNGAGISPEILDRVFVPFFTTKKEGSGIGLSLSKQIMLLHKGKISINSEEEKGTVVKLLF